MEKKFIAMLVCVALMGCIFVSAQDICKTVANVPMVQLNNGVLMPQFGLGTFMQSSGSMWTIVPYCFEDRLLTYRYCSCTMMKPEWDEL